MSRRPDRGGSSLRDDNTPGARRLDKRPMVEEDNHDQPPPYMTPHQHQPFYHVGYSQPPPYYPPPNHPSYPYYPSQPFYPPPNRPPLQHPLFLEQAPTSCPENESRSTAPIVEPPSSGASNSRVSVERPLSLVKTTIAPGFRIGHFRPDNYKVVNAISNIMKSKYDGAWVSFNDVPLDVRDMWFSEFQKHFTWSSEYDTFMKNSFVRKCVALLPPTLYKVRSSGRCPPWMSKPVFDALQKKWKDTKYMEKRKKAKENRLSTTGVGSSLHCGGVIPVEEHRLRFFEKHGREITEAELFLKLHQKKDEQGVMKWIDDKSKYAYDKYMEKMKTKSIEARKTGIPFNPNEMTGAEQIQLWKDTVGLTNKGGLYGLGLDPKAYRELKNSSSTACNSSHPTPSERSIASSSSNEYEMTEKIKQAEDAMKAQMESALAKMNEKWALKIQKRDRRTKRYIDYLYLKANLDPPEDLYGKKGKNVIEDFDDTDSDEEYNISGGEDGSDDDDD